MSKNIKKYSIIALISLVVLGCGSSDDNQAGVTAKDISQLGTFSDAEKLAYAIANQKKALNTTEPKQKRSRELQSCQNGGTMNFEADMNDYQNVKTTITYNNCLADGEILNGAMKMEGDENNGKITFLTNFTSTGGEDEVTVKPGSIQHIDEGNWEKMIINLEMTINGVTRAGENLIYKGKDFADGSSLEFPVSGKEKIGDSAYFTVDTTYDASKTPFKANASFELLSGLFKYKDDKNHKVELEVADKNVITVRVDSDGDNKFSEDEVSAISIE